MEKKSKAEELKEKLFFKNEHASFIAKEQIDAADEYCKDYMKFLDCSKTEREAVTSAERLAVEKGFVPFETGKIYNAGDKIYFNNRGKAIILAVMGKKSVDNGVRIAAAHIDSPRLDLKQNPIYEDTELALFKTHYYGGIKKYQWTVTPLALHGVIVKKGGEKVQVCIGEDDNDPKFIITDLLPHLAQEQEKRTLGGGIKGEELNILIGSRPFSTDETSENVKLNILNILFEKYGIIEKDFITAELEAVPAAKACDIGFDRSLIGSYGHDDRVCAYPALTAILETENPEYTVLTVLTDKEETGSDGNTGLQSAYMKHFIYDLAQMQGVPAHRVLSKCECLSADVNAAFDPTFPDVIERKNASYVNHGVVVTKYTGSRGKSGTSDASAEFVGKVRTFLDDNNVAWQTGELGKVDLGGGGTVAKYVANLDIDVVDVGVPVLSMHAPFEVVAKTDVYMAHRAFFEFFKY